jgi:N-methylhydantoinase A
MRYLLAADTGGTFTDIVVFHQRTKAAQFGKTLTNYRDLVAGVLDGLSDTDGHLDEAAIFKHGTTHVINAFVQRKGARVWFRSVGFESCVGTILPARPAGEFGHAG